MSAFSDRVLALGASGYWRVGESSGVTAQDAHANNNDGVITGTPTLGAQGAILGDSDTAISFPGTVGSYITIPDANPLDLGNTFSLLCLVKRGNTSGTHGLICKGASYRLAISGTHLLALKRVGTTIVSSTVTIQDTTKYHLLGATKNGSTSKLFIDGEDVTGTVTDLTIADSAGALILGSETAAASPLNGTGDEFAVFQSVVLTAAEMRELWLLARGVVLGLASETDTPQVTGRSKSITLTQPSEADTAQPVGKQKAKAIGQATETESAQPLSPTKQREMGLPAEQDEAHALDHRKRREIGQATEQDEAQSLERRKLLGIGQPTELDAAIALSALKRIQLGQALETDEALPMTTPGRIVVPIGLVTEIDTAPPITPLAPVTPPPPHFGGTTILPLRRLPKKLVPIGIAYEWDEALALTASKRQSELQTREEEELFALGSY